MAKITAAQSETIWNNRESDECISRKDYNSETKDNATFLTYNFRSILESDGTFYSIDSTADGLDISHESNASTIESKIKEHLRTMDKIIIQSESFDNI